MDRRGSPNTPGYYTLDSILATYRPINADNGTIARIRRLYSRLDPQIYGLYGLIWDNLMRHISSKGGSKTATISNLGFLCLLDLERTLFLQQIVSRTLSMAADPGRIKVIDLGAGTGILGLTALRLGARSLTLVENDKECLDFLGRLMVRMGYRQVSRNRMLRVFSNEGEGKKVRKEVLIYSGDAKTFNPARLGLLHSRRGKYNLVLCEMHETHLVSEDEVPALKNIRQYARTDTLFIPSADDLLLDICDRDGKALSRPIKIFAVDFGKIKDAGVSFDGRIPITGDGQAKYLRLWDRLHYPDNTICEQDFQMFTQTKYMLLRGWEPTLKKGQSLTLQVRFRFGDPSYNGYTLGLNKSKNV